MKRLITHLGIGLACAAWLGGCATRQNVPPDRIASAEAAVRTAEQHSTDTPENASAQLHLRLARDELSLARQNFDKDARRAEMLLIRARVDAELAQAMASTSEAQQQAHSTRLELEQLQASLGGERSSNEGGQQ